MDDPARSEYGNQTGVTRSQQGVRRNSPTTGHGNNRLPSGLTIGTSLFVSQRRHWIDSRRPVRGDVSGGCGDGQQKRADYGERGRIVGANAKEQALHRPP